jgi:ribosomal protein S27E
MRTNKVIVVHKTGHGAAFRKIRCPKCRIGYAVQSNINEAQYTCSRCGYIVKSTKL